MANTSYWHGPNTAKHHSRAVEAAAAVVQDAKAALLDALKREYPMGAQVLVWHSRGEFWGTVAGWDVRGTRVCVRNDNSAKVSKWWAAHVERHGAHYED